MRVAILIAAALFAAPVRAQEAPKPPPVAASIADVAWLEGSWIGTGIDGHPSGESYSRAGPDRIIGHFWQFDAAGNIDFTEHITIVPRNGGLVMRLKHFEDDLTGWEEKAGTNALEFVLSRNDPDRWVFGAVELVRTAPDRLETSVRVRGKDGAERTLRFSYRRANPAEQD